MTGAVPGAGVEVDPRVVAAAGNVEHPFFELATPVPALDQLDALQLGARVFIGTRIERRRDQKAGPCSRGRRRRQVSPHRHAPGVSARDLVTGGAQVLGVIPAAEEAHYRAGATGGVGLFSLHGREQCIPGVFFRVQYRQPAGPEFDVVG